MMILTLRKKLNLNQKTRARKILLKTRSLKIRKIIQRRMSLKGEMIRKKAKRYLL
jgi:hypothetical protein